jgi:hypothetical protein
MESSCDTGLRSARSAMFIDLRSQGTASARSAIFNSRSHITPGGVSRLRRSMSMNKQLLTELRIASTPKSFGNRMELTEPSPS